MVRVIAERCPDLTSVHNEIIAIANRSSLNITQVGTVVRLRKPLTPNLFTRQNVFDIALSIRVSADIEQKWARPVEADGIENDGRVVRR